MRRLFGLVCVIFALAGPAWSLQAQSSAELSRVPASAGLVMHVKAGTLYASPAMKDVRDLIAKAGPRAMQVFEERFQPGPHQIDRVTGVVLAPKLDQGAKEPPFAFLITTLVDINPKALGQRLGLNVTEQAGSPFPMWVEENGEMALALPEARLAIFGNKELVKSLATAPKDAGVPAHFQGMDKHHLSIVANLKALPPQISEFVPPPLAPLAKAETVKLYVDQDIQAKLQMEMNFPSEKDAVVAEDTIKELARQALASLDQPRREMLRMLENKPGKPGPARISELPEAMGGLLGLAALNQAEEILKNPPMKRTGNQLAAELTTPPGIPPALLAVGLLGTGWSVPAMGSARAAAARTAGANNLKQIGLAFHNYHDAYGFFPGDITDKKTGKPLLSWRVAILPYIEQINLHQQFKLDEPWDSENNAKLAKVLVQVYTAPNQPKRTDSQGNGLTHYQAFTGKKTLFELGKKSKIQNITDGTSNTILGVESLEPTIWTKPGGIAFDSEKDFPPVESILGGFNNNGFQALFCDGSVRFISNKIDLKTMKFLVMPSDGNAVNTP